MPNTRKKLVDVGNTTTLKMKWRQRKNEKQKSFRPVLR